MEKQNRKFDIEWMRSKLEKYLTLWEQYDKNPKLRKQYSKPFIVSNLLETIGALERIGDKGREFSNLKNKYRVAPTIIPIKMLIVPLKGNTNIIRKSMIKFGINL